MALAALEAYRAQQVPQLDFGLTSPEDSSVGNIARAMAAQALKDRTSGYLGDPQKTREHAEAWKKIADLDLARSLDVMTIMWGFDLVREAEDEIDKSLDPITDSFPEFSEDTRDLLKDVLRGLTAYQGYEGFGRQEIDTYFELGQFTLGAGFQTVRYSEWVGSKPPYDAHKFPQLAKVTPEKVMEGILLGVVETARNYPTAWESDEVSGV